MTGPTPQRTGSERAYTAAELLALERAENPDISPRFIRHWVEWGLLDHPRRRSLGRGHGSADATWGEHQRQLFHGLLMLRRRQRASPQQLVNIPVGIWLYYGDEYVPADQAIRAFRNWAKNAPASRWGLAERAARAVIDPLLHPSTGKGIRLRIRQILARIQHGDPWDAASLRSAAREAVEGPDGPRGPQDAPLSGRGVAAVIAHRVRGMANPAAATVAIYDQARAWMVLGERQYQLAQPGLAQDPDIGDLFQPRYIEDRLATACQDLALALGYVLEDHQAARKGGQPPPPRRRSGPDTPYPQSPEDLGGGTSG